MDLFEGVVVVWCWQIEVMVFCFEEFVEIGEQGEFCFEMFGDVGFEYFEDIVDGFVWLIFIGWQMLMKGEYGCDVCFGQDFVVQGN